MRPYRGTLIYEGRGIGKQPQSKKRKKEKQDLEKDSNALDMGERQTERDE